jgi:hypothetical protein
MRMRRIAFIEFGIQGVGRFECVVLEDFFVDFIPRVCPFGPPSAPHGLAFTATAFARDDGEGARVQSCKRRPTATQSAQPQHRAKLHSTNPLERVNGEIRTDILRIFPNEDAVGRPCDHDDVNLAFTDVREQTSQGGHGCAGEADRCGRANAGRVRRAVMPPRGHRFATKASQSVIARTV